MKTSILFIALCAMVSWSCSSSAPTTAKTSDEELAIKLKSLEAPSDEEINTQMPEIMTIDSMYAIEILAAIEEYGTEKYAALMPELNRLEKEFKDQPSVETKDNLISFLSANNLFAIITKPVSPELQQKALAMRTYVTPRRALERDINSVNAYYTDAIERTQQ